ncbi:MAG: tRNA (guanosine(37)-N1)-methyltransferase TrmD [Alphaproteobacteria bacterium]
MPWRATVLTIFPEMFPGPLGASLAGKALAAGAWALDTVDIRDFAEDRHRSVDDEPFGGGAGMVMRADVVDRALSSVSAAGQNGAEAGANHVDRTAPIIYLTPRGRPLDQARVRDLAQGAGLTLLCGRFEGVDQRVLEAWDVEEISLGDFVLSGGEPAALALLDAVVRLLPGVIGSTESLAEESFEHGLLEYPHYTRPAEWTDRTGVVRKVPEVLLSGHHGRVAEWRRNEAETATRRRRPDLWRTYRAAGDAAKTRK